MRYLAALLLILLSQHALAETEIDKNFWENCPGPACPLNGPEFRVFSEGGNANEIPKDLSKQKAIKEMEQRIKALEQESQVNKL